MFLFVRTMRMIYCSGSVVPKTLPLHEPAIFISTLSYATLEVFTAMKIRVVVCWVLTL